MTHRQSLACTTWPIFGYDAVTIDRRSASIEFAWGVSMRLRSCFSAFLLAICFANEPRAQTTTSGGVTGVVTDQSLAVLQNAYVEIRDINKGTTESTKTDRDGVYRFFFLSPSQYTLTVEHDRFRKESRSVTVLLETPVTVNITLEIAKAATQLFVTAEAPLVQADNGDVSITMSQRQISELQIGRAHV